MKQVQVLVNVADQQLSAIDQQQNIVFQTKIATAKNGVGQKEGSECTPLGSHRIRAKIGDDCELNTVFVGRRSSGEVYSPELDAQFPKRDWILTRILWLCGNEVGVNRGGDVDTMRRYVYIHGAPDSHPMGVPSSHGCIKMRNADVLALYELVDVGTAVMIKNE